MTGAEQIGVYVTAIVSALVVILGVIPKIAETWTKWLESRRRIAVSRDDADIVELRRQVKNLTDWRDDKIAMDREHMAWDREVYQKALAAGWDITPPPSLF